MSFLKRLFGGGAGSSTSEKKEYGDAVEHNGYRILATPFKEDGQYQTCGMITKTIDGELKQHQFIRADRFPSIDVAADHSIRKGRQLVEEQGDTIFSNMA